MAPSIATANRVGRAELLEFLRPRHHALLSTPERVKARNARRDPRVSLCVLSDDFNGPYVQVDGTAEVIDMPDAADALVDYYRCIAGEHPDWDEYREAMRRQGKSLIRVAIDRWGPIATGGFPARLAAGD
ncbi:PPOX class F420-dependent oxidoreductase [Actinomadura geliboluensis]|uniref:PPOX class F420-dependent oxidoreductase n=1 Tax=Actinomadura geliboluensis TaxID=882440 RepID=UPI003723C3BA